MNSTNYATEHVPALEYDEDSGEFTVYLDNLNHVLQAYRRSPIVKRFLEYEILTRRKQIHGVDDDFISNFTIVGFAELDEQGPYTFDMEWLEAASQWVEEEYE